VCLTYPPNGGFFNFLKMSKAEHNFYPKENSIPRYFNDRRSFRSNTPNKREDQIIERDIALSLISEIITDGRRAIPTIYWGIIMPEDLELVNFSKYRTHCPNCINGVYTNLWTFSEEYFSFTKSGKTSLFCHQILLTLSRLETC